MFKKSSKVANKTLVLEPGNELLSNPVNINSADSDEEDSYQGINKSNLKLSVGMAVSKKSLRQGGTPILAFSNKKEAYCNDVKAKERQNAFNMSRSDNSIKKVFISENLLNKAKTQHDIDIIYGKEKDTSQSLKEETNLIIKDYLKDKLYTLPIQLKNEVETKDDFEHLLKLSQTGLVEVPLPISHRLKRFEETEKEYIQKSYLKSDIEAELESLKMVKEQESAFSQGIRANIDSKKQQLLEKKFKDVFTHFNGKKRKIDKETKSYDNQIIEINNYK